jgi:hypothetical protein
MKASLVLFCSCLVLLTSCKTVSVWTDKEQKGIPFYAHKGMIKQQTKYLYYWNNVYLDKLTYAFADTTRTTLLKTRIDPHADLTRVHTALRRLNRSNSRDSLQAVMDEISKLKQVGQEPGPDAQVTIMENTWDVHTVVDYETVYYLNAPRPLFGTSTLTQKISAQGTLSEASGTADGSIDDIAGLVAGLATPLASIRVAQIENGLMDLASANVEASGRHYLAMRVDTTDETMKYIGYLKDPPSRSVISIRQNQYILRVDQQGYVYQFTKDHEVNERDAANTPITFDTKKGRFTRKEWPGPPVKKKKEEASTIKISGDILLPKPGDKQ